MKISTGTIEAKYYDDTWKAKYVEIKLRYPIRIGWWSRGPNGFRFVFPNGLWIPKGSFSIRIGRLEINRWTGDFK